MIKYSESVVDGSIDKKSVVVEPEVRMESLPESVNRDSEYDVELGLERYRKSTPVMHKVPQKMRRFSKTGFDLEFYCRKPGDRKIINDLGYAKKVKDNKLSRFVNKTQNFTFKGDNEDQSLEVPLTKFGIHKKSQPVIHNKVEPSLKSYLIEENNSIKLKNKSIDMGNQKLIHDYFELSEELE